MRLTRFAIAVSLLAVAGVALPPAARAQAATTWVTVHALDARGGPVTGARITLEGPDPRHAITDGSGRARFAHVRPGAYRASASGADVDARQDARVPPGTHVVITLRLAEHAAAAAGPRIESGHAGLVFDDDDARVVPRPSDPWSILRDVPGIVLDRLDVGGSETAQQSLVIARGDGGAGTTWSIDGFDVTDPAALGATSVYPEMEALASLSVRTAVLDARVRTPGAQVGLALREPGNAVAGRLHVRTSGPRSDNLPDELASRPFARPLTDDVRDFGAEVGGPLRPGSAWGWIAAGRDDLHQRTPAEHGERLSVTWLSAKARVRAAGGMTSLIALRSEKVHEDRDTTLSAFPEARWRQSGPASLLGVEDRRAWRGLSILTRAAWLHAGFRLDAPGGTAADAYEDFRGTFRGSFQAFATSRPRQQLGAEVAASSRRWGFDHRLFAGAGYRRSSVSTDVRWPGGEVLAFERQSVFFRTFRLTGFALPTRGSSARSVHDHIEAYAQDDLRRGRLFATLGLRADRLAGRNLPSRVEANPTFPELLPAVDYAGGRSPFRWLDVLPRAAAGWDIARDGSSSVTLSYAAMAAPLGSADITFDNPIGRETASLTYYWLDRNGDHTVQRDELDAARGLLGASGVDPRDPAAARSPHRHDPDYRSARTHELAAHLRQAVVGIAMDARLAWRRVEHIAWRPLIGLTLADYVIRGGVRGELFGQPYDVGYYAPASLSRIVPGNGRVLTNRGGYRQDAFTSELGVSGRAGGRVRWQAGLALCDWREFFPDPTQALQDPTPTDAEPLQDAGIVAVRTGGLFREAFVSARWTAGATLRADLPARFAAAARLHARDGFPIPYVRIASTGDPTAGSKPVLIAPHLDSYRLPVPALLDLRLSRDFRVPGGHLTAAIDVFNALGRSTTLQVARDVELPAFGRPREILRPRLVRFGLEYRFVRGPRLE